MFFHQKTGKDKKRKNYLFKLIKNYFSKEIKNIVNQEIRINILGEINKLPSDLKKILHKTSNLTKTNKR